MQTTLDRLGKHQVKLTIEATPAEVRPILDLAYQHLASSVSVPGFRKGRAPPKVVEAKVGRGSVLREFLDHALPTLYMRAVGEHELAPIGDPEFDDLDVADPESKGVRFSATVEVRPRLELTEGDYKGLRVDRPPAEVSEAELDEQMDRLRDRFAELDVVGHPARRGDYVVADIRAYVNDQEVPEASGQDVLYEVGSEAMVPELDRELEGARKGDILKLNAVLPQRFGERGGQEVSLSVLVKETKAKRLPDLDDDFARTASEFDSIEELRRDVRSRLAGLKEAQAEAAVRDRVLRAVADRVDVELPDSLVDRETESRVESARARAERAGATLADVLKASDVDELRFRADARAHAVRAIRADLALEAVARAEGIRVTDEDLDEAIGRLAKEVGRPPRDVRRQLEEAGQITSLAGDIIRDRALNLVVEHAEVVAEGGPGESEGKDG